MSKRKPVRLDWHNLYGQSWSGEIVPDAFAHPAKFSRALIRRIYQFLNAEGMIHVGEWVEVDRELLEVLKDELDNCVPSVEELKSESQTIVTNSGYILKVSLQGNPILPKIGEKIERTPSTILDCFGGVALGARDALQLGYNYVGVELEEKFCQIGGEGWECPGNLDLPTFDKKKTCEQAKFPICAACLTMWRKGLPSNAHHAEGNLEYWRRRFGHTFKSSARLIHGDSRELLKVIARADVAVNSPPYAESIKGNSADATRKRIATGKYKGRRPDVFMSSGNIAGHTYGDDYGNTAGQLGAIKPGDFDAAVSSPPYEANRFDGGNISKDKPGYSAAYRVHGKDEGNYSERMDNLGNTHGDDFWSAARVIVEQTHAALKPSAAAVWVCKDFVRAKKIVPFCDQWKQLCEAVGFTTTHYIRAWVIEDRGTKIDLEGNHHHRTTERKSFFRREAETKAAWRNYWETLARDVQARAIRQAHTDAWSWYNGLAKNQKSMSLRDEVLDNGSILYGIPRRAKIISAANGIAFRASGELTRDWNTDTRIDYEVVWVMRSRGSETQ